MMVDLDGAPPAQKFVPVCAIGASAGGVTALQNLFRQLQTDLGLAYVVILHLNPDEPSALAEILSVCTRMPVHQVEDGPSLTPNCVYVIPPDRELIIDGDNVTARPFTEPRGQRALIDMFFRSVAAGRGDGIAIVLSGTGSDGALGVSSMKEAGGVIMVQEPAEAGFAAMPQSAIATGMADFVGPIARLAERVAEVARSKEAIRSLDMDGSANDLRRIVGLLRARTGHDFSAYKRATVMRRVLRRMQVCRIVTFTDYADHLLTTPEEAQNLFSDLLISVTMFFRDEAAFETLARQAIRPMVENAMAEGGESLRIWVVGCATGEEAYSVAMLLYEELARQRAVITFQIFATDLDDGALATAREGRYPRSIEADVSEERLARFFVADGIYYRVGKELRESVLFAKHSILKEPPFVRLDLITCRNLLIYLERSLQAQICSIFHYSLRPGRHLFLGSAETVDAAADLFAPLDRQARIYSSRPNGRHRLPVLPQFAAPEQIVAPARVSPLGIERAALPALLHVESLENNTPASALVDDAQNILHLSPSAGRFILHSAGPVSMALSAVVRPELRLDLGLALTRALEQRRPSITLPTVVAFEGERRRVVMQISPVAGEAQNASRALVFFLDGGDLLDGEEGEAPPEASAADVQRLHAELKASQEALIVSRSQHITSLQELRAANEELQSMNEEYRSTAEELETSKEELQSTNEELHTVNAELKIKLETISAAHSNLQNLTAATEIGTLFLDPEMRIRFFTPPVEQLVNVTRHDVGRVITNFTHQLDYNGLEEDVCKVLQDLVPIEREVRSRRGQQYAMRLRPYRTVENRIDGTVVTFVDVSERARAEAAVRESEASLGRELANTKALQEVSGLLIEGEDDEPLYGQILDAAMAIMKADCATLQIFEPENGELRLLGHRNLHPASAQAWRRVSAGHGTICGRALREGRRVFALDASHDEIWESEHFRLSGIVSVQSTPLLSRKGRLIGMISTHWRTNSNPDEQDYRSFDVLVRQTADAFERVHADAALDDSEKRFSQFAASSSDALWIRDAATLAMEYTSPAIQTIYGIAPDAILGEMGRWVDLIVPEDRQTAVAHIQQAKAGASVTHEFRIQRPVDSEVRWIRSTDFPLRDAHGRVQRIGGIAQDITEAKRSGFRLEVLVNELQHRARNLLAVVTSIADRTVKQGGSAEAFEVRLQALSRAQGLISQGDSDFVEVGDLVRSELAAYATEASDRVRVVGPTAHLTARQVQNFALAVHELTTNAVKYGALKGDTGHLSVTWDVVLDRRKRRRLALSWVESGVAVDQEKVTRRGYGTELIQEALVYSLEAKIDYTLGADGVHCRIEMPLS
jgi:two-component system CheB/CheR fusion protein